jgi:hypothetical protein
MFKSVLRSISAPTLFLSFGLFAACASEMDGEPATEEQSQALLPPDDDVPRCPIDLGLGWWDNTFEGTLFLMGCQGKEQYGPARNGWAWFTTYCPSSTSPVSSQCPNDPTGWKTIYSVSDLVECWRDHAPEKPVWAGNSESECNTSLWGDVVVWDPNCVGGGCATWDWRRR